MAKGAAAADEDGTDGKDKGAFEVRDAGGNFKGIWDADAEAWITAGRDRG
jgi:hypothetical protein